MSNLLFVDRFEGETVVCEDESGARREFPRGLLPPGTREGDCLRETPEGILPDPAETVRRKKKNRDLFQSLLKKKHPPEA